MASKITKSYVLLTTLYVVVMKPETVLAQKVPCLYFFGDSQFDNGNNNALITEAKANYRPYGIDYPEGPDRFSNGRNIADYLAQFLGFDRPIPPLATSSYFDLPRGVNYGSGAAGILDESGRQYGDRISMDRQLLNHKKTGSRLAGLLFRNSTKVNEYLNKCLYVVNMGSNDYLNNYLMPQEYPSSSIFTPDQFAEILIQKFNQQLRTLYRFGARKVAVYGIGLLGCLPGLLPANPTGCVDSINNMVQLFNNRLNSLIGNLNTNLPGAQFTYINTTSISSGDPSAIGIRVANAPCCVVNPSTGQCARDRIPCSNRKEYAFWDNFHPTEIVNLVTASRSYTAALASDANPVDIQTLVQQ